MPSAGLVGAGAGMVNAAGAVELVCDQPQVPRPRLAAKTWCASGIHRFHDGEAGHGLYSEAVAQSAQTRGVWSTRRVDWPDL